MGTKVIDILSIFSLCSRYEERGIRVDFRVDMFGLTVTCKRGEYNHAHIFEIRQLKSISGSKPLFHLVDMVVEHFEEEIKRRQK